MQVKSLSRVDAPDVSANLKPATLEVLSVSIHCMNALNTGLRTAGSSDYLGTLLEDGADQGTITEWRWNR